jgi:hypothetical protein
MDLLTALKIYLNSLFRNNYLRVMVGCWYSNTQNPKLNCIQLLVFQILPRDVHATHGPWAKSKQQELIYISTDIDLKDAHTQVFLFLTAEPV